MKIYKVKYYSEDCCELCNETIHNHSDCPVCKVKYAGTSVYCDIQDGLKYNQNELSCEGCNTEFHIEKVDYEYVHLTLKNK